MRFLLTFATVIGAGILVAPAAAAPVSHPALRPAPPAPTRPAADGLGYFVNPAKGNDSADGSKGAPWRTIRHAVTKLKPGDTLYLHGGTYYETAYIALAGRPDAPITIRSAPGETAIIDGGLAEFFASPAEA